MMNFNEIKELVQLIEKSNLTGFSYQKDGLKLKIEKRSVTALSNEQLPLQNIQPSNTSFGQTIVSEPTTLEFEKTQPEMIQGKIVKSPLVGVYYASPTPTSEPFIQVGQKVNKGDVLCIVEAMKVMNEVVAEYEGEILEIYADNEVLVEYGQSLVRIG
jgi:acetyl-CoA carboxylase biotin carboxyl carrier protein